MATSLPRISCKVCGYKGEPTEGCYDSDKGEFTCEDCVKNKGVEEIQ